jgi:hypothetical protein
MPDRRFSRFPMLVRHAGLLAAALILPGCAAVSTADGQRLELTSAEFRAYVERVFREQNRLTDELAFALEDAVAPSADLAAAEQALLEACAGVNALATARRDERRLGMHRSAVAARSVPECEQASRAAVDALASAVH